MKTYIFIIIILCCLIISCGDVSLIYEGGVNIEEIFFEDFENTGGANWNYETDWFRVQEGEDGGYCAKALYTNPVDNSYSLVLNDALDFSHYEEIYIEFSHLNDSNSDNYDLTPEIWGDSDATWDGITDGYVDTFGWRTERFEITEYGYSDAVSIRFRYNDYGAGDIVWCIDNIRILGLRREG